MSSENTDRKQMARFQPGRSGNPNGRPVGARNATTIAVETLLDGQAEKLTQKLIQLALEGDPVALRLCMDRLSPPRKDRPVTFPLRPIYAARDAADALADVAAAVAVGTITPADADAISNVLGRAAKAFEIADAAVSGATLANRCSDDELYRIIERAKERETAQLVTDARQ